MRGDAVGTGGFADQRGFDWIGFAALASAVARLTESRDVIDVDPEFEHQGRPAAGAPGLESLSLRFIGTRSCASSKCASNTNSRAVVPRCDCRMNLMRRSFSSVPAVMVFPILNCSSFRSFALGELLSGPSWFWIK